MKINEPLTKEAQQIEADNNRALAIRQAEFSESVAAKIEQGQPLNALERQWAAGALRGTARQLLAIDHTPAGQLKKLPDEARMLFAIELKLKGKSQDGAIKAVAEHYNVSEQSVKKLIGMLGSHKDENSAETKRWLNFIS